MPYVCVRQNRYIGEHSCNNHTYGDQTMVRPCCVADAQKQKANVKRVAMTTSHPAYALWCAAWNCLTDAERWIVGDLTNVYDHGPAGFVDRPMQKVFDTLI